MQLSKMPRTKTKCVIGILVLGLCIGMLAFAVSACAPEQDTSKPEESATLPTDASTDISTTVRVASLKGPTSIGLLDAMERAKEGSLTNDYSFTIAGTADEILPKIVQGDVDIALIPANVASVLYAKTNGGLKALNINTLGVLSVVSGNAEIQSLDDLAGRTVYLTGKGTTPEYVMNYLLVSSGLEDVVTLEYKSEATELAALLSADPSLLCVLPEPYATSVCTKNPALARVISLTEAWDVLQGSEGSKLVTGVTIVRTEFLAQHPAAVDEFLAAQEASVMAVNANPAAAAQLVVDAGIVGDTAIAQAAIPYCNLTYIDGKNMKNALEGYYRVLFEQNPAAVGDALPDNDFYFE